MASQFVERYNLKQVWARDAWRLTSRLPRKVLSYTVAVFLFLAQGHPRSPSPGFWISMKTRASRK